MGKRRLIDLDEDLLDSDQAAALLGISIDSFFVYVKRYEELQPAISRGRYIRLWLRQDLLKAQKARPGIGSRTNTRDGGTDPS